MMNHTVAFSAFKKTEAKTISKPQSSIRVGRAMSDPFGLRRTPTDLF